MNQNIDIYLTEINKLRFKLVLNIYKTNRVNFRIAFFDKKSSTYGFSLKLWVIHGLYNFQNISKIISNT